MTERELNERPALFWVIFGTLLLVALFLRTYDIDLRPLHNDEGVNWHFIKGMRSSGYYPYSHLNYHGPAYFYITFWATRLLGDGELGMRLTAVLCGVLMLAALAPLRRSEGSLCVLIMALLAGTSSSLVFYSRYAIHETLFLLATFGVGLSGFLWIRTEKPYWIYSGAAALAVLIATKETFIISLFCLFFALCVSAHPRRVLQSFLTGYQHIIFALLLTSVLIVLIFTGGLQWSGGLREMFLAVPQWVGRNTSDVGHFKPARYYIDMCMGPELFNQFKYWSGLGWGMLRETLGNFWGPENSAALERWVEHKISRPTSVSKGAEPLLGLALILPLPFLIAFPKQTIREIFSERGAFARFTGVWALLAFLVYSYVDYKTPWLIINITFPALLFTGWWLKRLFSYASDGDFLGWLVLVLAVAAAGWYTWRFNFEEAPYGYGRYNPYSYVHTHAGMIDLVRDIDHYLAGREQRTGVLVGVRSYWPLPYYLRQYDNSKTVGVGYQDVRRPQDHTRSYQVIIADRDVIWKERGWIRKYYRLSDVQEAQVYYRIG